MSAKELNIGDYVRTKSGNIFKIIGGNTDNWEVDMSCIQLEQTEENWYESNRYNNNGYWFNEENIIKSSPNIIDLIEVGDFLNGWRVEELEKDTDKVGTIIKVGNSTFNVLPDEEIWLPKHTNYDHCQIEKLKSIVTKKQFESMEYKIGE